MAIKTNQVRANVRGALHGIAAGSLDDKVRQAIADSGLTDSDLKSPKTVIALAVAMVASVPKVLRKPVLLGLSGIIRTDARFAGLSSFAVPEILEGIDAGTDELLEKEHVDSSELFRKLVERLSGTERGKVATATNIADGAAWTSKVDGTPIHRAGCTECGEVAKAGDPNGTPETMFRLYPHRPPCTKCWEVVGATVTVKVVGDKPADGPHIVDPLAADAAGDGSKGRALAMFDALIAARAAEVIDEPTGSWYLDLMHRKGLPKTSKAVGLLPTFTQAQADALYGAIRTLRAGQEAYKALKTKAEKDAWVPDAAATAVVVGMVDLFRPYMAEIKLVAERDVNDVREGLAKTLDFFDDRITARQRRWLVDTLISRKPLYILGVVAALYVLTHLGTAALAAAITLLIMFVTFGLFMMGAVPLLGAAYGVVVWPLPVFPMHLLFVGWCLVFLVCAAGATFDGLYGRLKAMLQGWIPLHNRDITGWVLALIVHWLKKFNLVPEPPAQAEGATQAELAPKDGLRKLFLTTSVAASIISILVTVLMAFGDVMVQGGHAHLYVTLLMILFIGLGAEWGRRFHYLYTWDDRVRLNKRATGVLLGGLVVCGLLLVCGGAFNALLGGDNLKGAHRGLQQEVGESVGTRDPEHYQLGQGPVCEVFPETCSAVAAEAAQKDLRSRQAKSGSRR